MKIKKIGHCCLVVEHGGLRIMTDPGEFSTEQESETDIDAVLITHEHSDHLHLDSLKKVLQKNPTARVITNSAVGKLLDQEQIDYLVLEDGQAQEISGVEFSGHGSDHEEIYKDFARVMNTGYMIGSKLYYPGDSFFNPGKEVEILALPVAGPWVSIKNSVRFALELKPKVAFPVHDGMEKIFGGHHKVPEVVLGEKDIEFRVLNAGDETEV